MPIRPENRKLYPRNWPDISKRIKERAKWRCEECGAAHCVPHPETGSIVILTVAHLDHDPRNCAADNLRALCQRCHNRLDAPIRRARRRARLAREAGQQDIGK